ncbi:hypothetical protein D918_03811 [Trichuris suis]|nr:hypothetical protein D918_03811 [Trichuris suis]
MLSEGLRGHMLILCDNAHSNALPLILIIRFMLMLVSASALSCFCNEELCTDEMCKNKDCIVGIQRKDGALPSMFLVTTTTFTMFMEKKKT